MKLTLKQVFTAMIATFALSNVWAAANIYTCNQVKGSGQVEIRIQHPSMLSGKYVKLSDLRDGGHGPKYDYDAVSLDQVPAGMPEGSYVLATTGMLGLILDVNMYSGVPQAYAAEAEHNSTEASRIYQCQLK